MSDTPPAQLGDYDLQEILHETDDTQTYVARQRSIDRTVALVLLKPHRCANSKAVAAFREDIKAKARVTHPRIASVYEASEQDGVVFYTREVVSGQDIAELRAEGHRFPLSFVWDLLRTVCDTFLYYEKNQLGSRAFQPEALVLIHEEPYMANLATAEPTEPTAFAESLEVIRTSFWRLLRADDTHLEDVRRLFSRMDPEHARVYRNWNDLQRACNIATQVTSSPTPSLAEQEGLMVPEPFTSPSVNEISVEVAQARSQLTAVLTVLLIGVALTVGWWWYQANRPMPAVENPMVRVPEGPFIFQKDQRIELPEFWISKYEITIAQYAVFLAEAMGSKTFDHVDQPKSKSGHASPDWANFYAAAQAQGVYRGESLNVNCPIVGVDWWDAYAYARWRGGRLPNADEWEKAARGTEGLLYPWGSESDSSKANTGLDYNEEAGAGGELDGFNAWAPVDQLGADVSPFGVVGMAGNVSEWTATHSANSDSPDDQKPVVKGASFVTKETSDLTQGRLPSADKASMSRGFRITADSVR